MTSTTTITGSRPEVAQPALAVDELCKSFGETIAVAEMSFEVPTGTVTGFIGPNGAGKTTTMAMLLGLVRPTSGTATILGQTITNPAGYLSRVGALIEDPALWPGLTGEQNLRALATLGGHDRAQIPELLDVVGLGGRGRDRYGDYSMGMKQRLGIAAALLGAPDLLVLDEPTNGLDPAGMDKMRRLIGELGRGERTVFVSSHILSELEQICDWLVVVDDGHVLYQGSADDFLGASAVVVATPADPDQLPGLRDAVRGAGLDADLDDAGTGLILASHDDAAGTARTVGRAALEARIALAELRSHRPDLEARYLNRISQGADR